MDISKFLLESLYIAILPCYSYYLQLDRTILVMLKLLEPGFLKTETWLQTGDITSHVQHPSRPCPLSLAPDSGSNQKSVLSERIIDSQPLLALTDRGCSSQSDQRIKSVAQAMSSSNCGFTVILLWSNVNLYVKVNVLFFRKNRPNISWG